MSRTTKTKIEVNPTYGTGMCHTSLYRIRWAKMELENNKRVHVYSYVNDLPSASRLISMYWQINPSLVIGECSSNE